MRLLLHSRSLWISTLLTVQVVVERFDAICSNPKTTWVNWTPLHPQLPVFVQKTRNILISALLSTLKSLPVEVGTVSLIHIVVALYSFC
jgi:hypothetical protein